MLMQFGVAVALVGWGMGKATPALEAMLPLFEKFGDWEMIGAIATMGPALALLGIGMLVAAIGMMAFGIGLVFMAIGLGLLKAFGVLDSMEKIAIGMGQMFANAGNASTAISALTSFLVVLEELGDEEDALANLAKTFADIAESAQDLDFLENINLDGLKGLGDLAGAASALESLKEMGEMNPKVATEFKGMFQHAHIAAITPVVPGSAMAHMSEMFERMEEVVKGLESAGGTMSAAMEKKKTKTIQVDVGIDGRTLWETMHRYEEEHA